MGRKSETWTVEDRKRHSLAIKQAFQGRDTKALMSRNVPKGKESPRWNRIVVSCEFCGKEKEIHPHRVKISKARDGRLFCDRECYKAWFGAFMKMKVNDPSYENKGLFRKGHMPWNKGMHMGSEWRQRASEACIKGLTESMHLRPTEPEASLMRILQTQFPEFKYNGDFSLGITIGGMIPDFVNVNGKKQVIEVFGDYWHGDKKAITWRKSELGRIMAYKPFGFNCLVIWEHELKEKPEREIACLIKSFSERRK